MRNRGRRRGFTLIDLVMVIVIIGILAVIAIPKFYELKQKAICASEDAVIAALQAAINRRHSENIAKGVGDVWPQVLMCNVPGYLGYEKDLFSLLDNPPPSSAPDKMQYGNGVYWILSSGSFGGLGGVSSIACPHYTSSTGPIGKTLIYNHNNVPISGHSPDVGALTIAPGEIGVYCDRCE